MKTDTIKVHLADGPSATARLFSKTFTIPESAILYEKSRTNSDFDRIVGEKIRRIDYCLTSLYLVFSPDAALHVTSADRRISARLTETSCPHGAYSTVEVIRKNDLCEIVDISDIVSTYVDKNFKRIHLDGAIAWIYCQNTSTLLCCSLKSIYETELPMICVQHEE